MKGPKLAERLDGIAESATLRLNATVQALKARGVDVINLTAGEPDFKVPDAAKEAAIAAIRSDQSKYTAVAGIAELRQTIADKTNRQQPALAGMGKAWKSENVVVTNGAKQALFNAFMALVGPGDDVLIPSPYWLSYPEMVRIAQASPRFIEAPFSQGFKITPEQLGSALRASAGRARILILSSPCNPTGAVYSRAELRALGDVLAAAPEARDLWVVSDEIYDRIVYGSEPFCSFLSAVPEWAERTVTVNGMSKSAAMTGWRVGWSVAPKPLTQALITLQGQSTSNVNAPAQWASLAALGLPEAEFDGQRRSYLRRRDLCLDILRKAGKMEISAPGGAFYLFVGIGRYLGAGEGSLSFAEKLLEQAQVAVVPGEPFGAPTFIRLSFATDERSLQDGCERIVGFLG